MQLNLKIDLLQCLLHYYTVPYPKGTFMSKKCMYTYEFVLLLQHSLIDNIVKDLLYLSRKRCILVFDPVFDKSQLKDFH